MASNTTNYNLVKPAYADDADIADINGNMDIIDGAMKDLADNVADTYNSASTYAVGDRCTYGGVLYKCTTAISTAEAWNSAHWTACTVDEVMASNSGAIDTLQEEIGIVINGNTSAVNVVKGQYVIVKNSTIVGITDGLYTYNDSTTKTAGNTFISSELDAVPNGGLNALNSKITTEETSVSNTIKARKQGNVVCLNGYEITTIAGSTVIGSTLPSAFRPVDTVRVICSVGQYAYRMGKPAYLNITTDGVITIVPPDNNTYAAAFVNATWIV